MVLDSCDILRFLDLVRTNNKIQQEEDRDETNHTTRFFAQRLFGNGRAGSGH